MQEIAVIQSLQTKIGELTVTLGIQGGTEFFQVVLGKALIEQFSGNTFFDESWKIFGIAGGHIGLHRFFAQHFFANGVHQQTRRDLGVGRVFFNQGARCEGGGFENFFLRHAFVQIFQGCFKNTVGFDKFAQTFAGGLNHTKQEVGIQRDFLTINRDIQRGSSGSGCLSFGLGAFSIALFAIQHIGARDFMRTTAHQGQFNLILHFFDVEGAAGRLEAQQRGNNGLGQLTHLIAHPGAGRFMATVDGEKGFGQGNGNFVRRKRGNRAVATNNLVRLIL